MTPAAGGAAGPTAERGEIRVLVVEDSLTAAELIRRSLESDGMSVDLVTSLADARAHLAADPPDVVVLDVELPDGSGLDFLRDPSVAALAPILLLSSRQEEPDRVIGLELGAEDYMIKPFFPRELATRVRRAASRRTAGTERRTTLDFGGLHIDVASREVVVGGVPAPFTDREFDLLVHLASAPRTVFDREELLRAVWRSSSEWQTPKTVTEHIRRIRHKIEEDPTRPRRIVTVGRAGYRFEPG